MTYLGACAGPGWIFRSAAFVGRSDFPEFFQPAAARPRPRRLRGTDLWNLRTTDKPIKRYDIRIDRARRHARRSGASAQESDWTELLKVICR